MARRPSPLPPLVVFAVGVVLGDIAAPLCTSGEPALVGFTLAAVALVILSLFARRTGAAAVFVAGGCAGLALIGRLSGPLPGLPERVRGVVVGTADGHDADVQVSAVASPGEAWRAESGRLRVRFPLAPPAAGAVIVVGGTAHALPRHALPGAPTERWSVARAHVRALLTAKDVVVEGPEPLPSPARRLVHAGLVAAMAGQPGTVVAPEEKGLLQRTGTWHFAVVSGVQVGLVAAGAWALMTVLARPLVVILPAGGMRWLSAIAAGAGAFGLALGAGAPVSAIRAALCASVCAVARAAGVTVGAWEGLAFAVCGVLLVDPGAVDHLGFQFAVSAIAGIILWSSRIVRWLPLDAPRALRWAARSLGASVGALVGTLPIAAWRLQTFSPMSPVCNLLVAPLLGLVGAPAALLGFATSGVARLDVASAFLLTVADTAADFALRVLQPLDVTPWHPAVGPVGAVLLGLAALCPRRPLVAAGIWTFVLGTRWPVPPEDGRLVVQFLAVGQGDSAIVSFPDGRVWLVDTGPEPDDVLDVLRREGITHLDRVILSHPHPDHFGGLEAILENLDVDELIVPRAPRLGLAGETGSQRAAGGFAAAAESERTYARLLGLARRVDFAEIPAPGVLLHPWLGWRSPARDPVNDESVVFRIDFGKRRFLFTGDVEKAGEAELLAHHGADLHADVLKVPHHGSKTSSSWPFVTAVNPLVSVISCGEDNRFHHPNPLALAHYRGRRVYRTDLDGTVVVSTDGTDLHVDLPDAEPVFLDPDPVPAGAQRADLGVLPEAHEP